METTPCHTCKYKETAGEMVDPCFPCLLEHSFLTGEPKEQYDHWTDENLSWEEIKAENERQMAELEKAFDNPEGRALIKKVADTLKRRSSV